MELIDHDTSGASSSQKASSQTEATPSRGLTPPLPPSKGPTPPLHIPQSSSSTGTSHSPQGGSPRASGPHGAQRQSSDGTQASSGDHTDDASSLTTRSSGSQHGMQLSNVKPQKGSNLKGAASGELGIGKRKGSMRAEARKTSEELPDVTGRQSDHTIFDATGIRRVSTAGRRVFGSSA